MARTCRTCGAEIPEGGSGEDLCPSCLLRLGLTEDASEPVKEELSRLGLTIGQRLSHYTILDYLGKGGMGEVYRAEDTTLKRQVALKVLPAGMSDSRERLERFQREAETLATLDHPSIVTIHTVEKADGVHFLTMELVEGKRLSEVIPQGGMTLERLLDTAVPLAEALAAAHARGVVHRDLKPGNVMVTEEGRVKVLDFGLAKLLEEPVSGLASDASTESLTQEGRILGTAAYMSPEQAAGRPVDSRSDVFSFGVLLYEMACGRRPFEGDSSISTLARILEAEPVPLGVQRADLPHDLQRIVSRCLRKPPGERYHDSRDLVVALKDLREESGSRTAMPITRALPTARRWPLKTMAMAGVAAILALLVLSYVVGRRSITAPDGLHSLAVLPFANLTGDPGQDHLAEGLSAGLITKLSEVQGIRLVGRSESWKAGESASQLGKRLGVGALVDGEIQKEREDLRATVNLTDAESGLLLWSDVYTAPPGELFQLQSRIARDLATFLSIRLSRKERRRLAADPTGSLQAYNYYMKGQKYLHRGGDPRNADFAADNFRQAIRIDPDFALAHVGLSEALWRIYRRDLDREALSEAEREAELAQRLDPELPAVQVALARVYRSTGRYDESIEELSRALGSHPKPDQALRELAVSYEEAGDLSAAAECLRSAIALREDYWHHWNALGAFLVKVSRYAEAREAFQRAAELAPEGITWPLRNLVSVRMLEGDFAGAIEAFEQFGEEPDTAKLAGNIGTAYFFTHRLEEAEKYYRLAVKLDPRDPLKHGNLADLYLRQGRQEAARAEYRAALHLVEEALLNNPKSNRLRVSQALYSAKAGECAAASRLATRRKVTLPATGEFAHARALVHALCGERAAALDAIRSAIELGFSAELIRQEDEFRSLQDDPEFLALVGAES